MSTLSSDWFKYPGRRVLDQTVFVNGTWTTQKVNPLKLEPVIITKLRICTYNIWFGNERQELRMQHILKIIEDNDVDIFCFQEVTATLLKYLLSNPFVQKYYLSGITNNEIGAYGNVIFSRFPLIKVYLNHYQNTGMGRKLVCVDTIINNELFRIGTVHLESLAPGARKRVIQLKNSMRFMLEKQKTFQRPTHLMIMGDFNECATSNKKALLMPDIQFIDAWSIYHGGDGKYEKNNPGWTMPESDYFPPWRPDRLYYSFNYDYSEIDKLMKEKQNNNGSLDSDENEQVGLKNEFNDINEYKNEENIEINGDDDEDIKKQEFTYEVRGKKGEWKLKSIIRVGMNKISITKEEKNRITVMTPSDHYGLVSEFVCVGTDNEEMTEIVKKRKFDNSSCCIM